MCNTQFQIQVDCKICGNVQTIRASTTSVKRYLAGELVQNVWPDAETNWRECMIGFRTGMYVCPIHTEEA